MDDEPTIIANSRLIVAAPDLLAAARRALNVLKSQGESVRPGNVLGALAAAISKATGEESDGSIMTDPEQLSNWTLADIAEDRRLDPREPDYSRSGVFQDHNCWKCDSGKKPCIRNNPRDCDTLRARND